MRRLLLIPLLAGCGITPITEVHRTPCGMAIEPTEYNSAAQFDRGEDLALRVFADVVDRGVACNAVAGVTVRFQPGTASTKSWDYPGTGIVIGLYVSRARTITLAECSITEAGDGVLAHEMFHAIQDAVSDPDRQNPDHHYRWQERGIYDRIDTWYFLARLSGLGD